MRGVTRKADSLQNHTLISTHTPHARRDVAVIVFYGVFIISTHTPHARRDSIIMLFILSFQISTHTPHARRDGIPFNELLPDIEFQLTRLMRGVTLNNSLGDLGERHFNSHASCEA